MGLAPRGRGAAPSLEGWTQKDGRLPVNPSGGLKSKGHPIGATGVSMHVLTAMQLTGEAGEMQVAGCRPRRHLQHGRRRVANYVASSRRCAEGGPVAPHPPDLSTAEAYVRWISLPMAELYEDVLLG